MAVSLNPEKIKRYKDIISLLLKYGSTKVISSDPLDEIIIESTNGKEYNEKAIKFARDLEELGPTFIKLGQLLSTRPDFISQNYIDALSRLQDNVEPFPFEKVEEIIQKELNVRISKAFSEFNAEPLAAASLGQVHRAKLRDGRDVAVKIQRPDIREIIKNDLEALYEVASSLDQYTEAGKRYGFKNILNEFKKALVLELDYNQEAENLIRLKNDLQNFKNIIIPLPIEDYTTECVLTMEYVEGKKITSISPLGRIELNGKTLAEDLFKAYLDQVLANGFFHADPHPGNVFITNDKKLALLDLGMVANIDPDTRENLLKLLLYISEGKGYEAAKLSMKIGIEVEEDTKDKFIEQVTDFVTRHQDIKVESLNIGRMVLDLTRIAGENGIRLPSNFTMLGKTLLNLDEIGRTLDPEFNPNAEIRNYAQSLMRKQMVKNLSPGNIFSSMLEMNELVQKLPARLNNFMEALTENKFQFTIKAFDDIELMFNLQKIANRITLGLVIASLIIGAALMMQVQTTFTIFGYPGLAVIFFFIAVVFGFGLIYSILWGDKHKSSLKK